LISGIQCETDTAKAHTLDAEFMVEMEIFGLTTSTRTASAYALILIEAGGSRRLPIIIGAYEAQAIALEMEQIKPPRPMTHDLTMQIITDLGGQIEHVVVHHLKEGTYYANISIKGPISHHEVDARPSDAIALAVRFTCPIYVDELVLEEAGVEHEEKPAEVGHMNPTKKPHTRSTEEKKSPLELLHEQLQIAIETENYEKAANLRDQIQRLKG
jgi:bifunctional DNase/RNase